MPLSDRRSHWLIVLILGFILIDTGWSQPLSPPPTTPPRLRQRPLQSLFIQPAEALVVIHSDNRAQFPGHTVTHIDEWEFSSLTAADFALFKVIYLEPPWQDFRNLQNALDDLSTYVYNGGTAVINIANTTGGDRTDIAPGGVDFLGLFGSGHTHNFENIQNPSHPYITGQPFGGVSLTTDDFNNWSATDFGHLTELPPNAQVVLHNDHGPSWVQYPFGTGQVIVTTLAYGWASGNQGNGLTGPSIQNLYKYALFLSDRVISVTPVTLDFGAVVVGQMATATLTIHNSGAADLRVTDINDPFFTVSDTAFTVAPGDSHVVTVTFTPTSVGTVVDTLCVLSNDLTTSVVKIPLSGTALPSVPIILIQPLSLQFGPVAIGHTKAESIIVLNVGTSDLIVTDINDSLFSVSDTLFTVAPGDSHVVVVMFAPTMPGAFIDTLSISNNDPGIPVLQVLVSGIAFLPGDLTQDGVVNILDIIGLVGILVGRQPRPTPETLAFLVADCNGDGALNILDIVCQVNKILRVSMKPMADGPTRPVTVGLGEPQILNTGQSAIPVTVQADGVIAGFQATITFNPAQLQLGTPRLVGRAAEMTVEHQVTDGTLHMVAYSATGQGIIAGDGPILLIPVTSFSPIAGPQLTLSEVMLANRQAQAIPVTLETSTVKVAALPTVFALLPNRPNPFNPSTEIVYEVPQPAHVTLAVYNVLGQEVVRLVDEMKTPGRYVVTWDGRNSRRVDVASSLYLYRLTTSTGFSQTRRMLVLK